MQDILSPLLLGFRARIKQPGHQENGVERKIYQASRGFVWCWELRKAIIVHRTAYSYRGRILAAVVDKALSSGVGFRFNFYRHDVHIAPIFHHLFYLSHFRWISKSFAHNRQELRAKIAHNRQEGPLIRFHALGSFYANLRWNLESA